MQHIPYANEFNTIKLYLYSTKSKQHLSQGALYCKLRPTLIQEYKKKLQNSYKTPYQQTLGESGKEKFLFKKKNL